MSLEFLGNVPLPDRDPLVGDGGLLSEAWRRYLSKLPLTLGAAPMRVSDVALTGQGASIGATNMAPAGLPAGLYRATYYARITTVGSVSSSLTVTLAWTDGGVACTFSGSAITGNTTATTQSGTQLIHIDRASAVNYSTTYASNAAGEMKHSLYWTLELVKP